MAEILAATALGLFALGSGASHASSVAALMVRDGRSRSRWQWLYYLAGALLALYLLPLFTTWWEGIGVVSAAEATQGIPLIVVTGSAAIVVIATVLLQAVNSPWQIWLGALLGVGISAFVGYTHLDRFLGLLLPSVLFGSAVTALGSMAVRWLLNQLPASTKLYVFAGPQAVSAVPRGDNPLTSMMAMSSVTTIAKLDEQTDYRVTSTGARVAGRVGWLADGGVAMFLCLRGLWDTALLALIATTVLRQADIGWVVLGSTVALGLGGLLAWRCGLISADLFGGATSREAQLGSSWGAVVSMIGGAFFGIPVDPSQAHRTGGTVVSHRRQTLAAYSSQWASWLAAPTCAAAFGAVLMFLLHWTEVI